MSVCDGICMGKHMRVSARVSTYMWIHIHVHVYEYRFIYVWVHITCVWVRVHVCEYTCTAEISLGHHSSGAFRFDSFDWDRVSLLSWGSPCRLGWLARQPVLQICLSPPLKCWNQNVCIFKNVASEDQNQVLVPMRQELYWLSYFLAFCLFAHLFLLWWWLSLLFSDKGFGYVYLRLVSNLQRNRVWPRTSDSSASASRVLR